MTTPDTRLFFGEGVGRPIRIATDLVRYLRVDRRHHYRDGYSMAEAAKCWVQANARILLALRHSRQLILNMK